MYPDVQVLHIDFADYCSWAAKIPTINFYDFSISRAPKLYSTTYALSDNTSVPKVLAAFKFLLSAGVKKILKKIKDYQPDYIISTHFLAPMVLPKNLPAPLDTVITDYHAHRIWLTPNVRNFFVATEEIKNDLEKFGVKSIVSGIPIHPKFFRHKEKDELKKQFGIDNDLPVVLLMPIKKGNITAKDAVTAIFSCNKDVNLVAVTGKNNDATFKALEKIKNSGQKNFIILKNANNIDEWMRVADVVVSKAGGLTISECIYLQKPMVIINPIPGQEDYNADYIEKNNFGFKANSNDELAKNIQKILYEKTGTTKKYCTSNACEIILNEVFKTDS